MIKLPKKCAHCGAPLKEMDKFCLNCGRSVNGDDDEVSEQINETSSSVMASSSTSVGVSYNRMDYTAVYCTNCGQVVNLQKTINWYVVIFLLICCCCGIILYFLYYLGVKEPDTCPICRERLVYVHQHSYKRE